MKRLEQTPCLDNVQARHSMMIQRQMRFVDVLELRLAKTHRHAFMAAEQGGVDVDVDVDPFEAIEQTRGWVGRAREGGGRGWPS